MDSSSPRRGSGLVERCTAAPRVSCLYAAPAAALGSTATGLPTSRAPSAVRRPLFERGGQSGLFPRSSCRSRRLETIQPLPTTKGADQQEDGPILALRIVDHDPAPFLRCDVAQRLGEGPPVAGRIEEGALPLAVREIFRFPQDRAVVLADTVAEGCDVFDSEHHRLRPLLAGRGCAVIAKIGHDQRAAAEAQLRAMAGPDPYALDEPENLDQPVDGGADVRIGEFGNHRPERR